MTEFCWQAEGPGRWSERCDGEEERRHADNKSLLCRFMSPTRPLLDNKLRLEALTPYLVGK